MLIGEQHLVFAATFGAMAFSTFVFDTLDVSTRLGRYILQELLGWKGRAGAMAATALMCFPPLAMLWVADAGQLPAVLDAVRHVQPAAGRAVAAGGDGLAAPIGAALHSTP